MKIHFEKYSRPVIRTERVQVINDDGSKATILEEKVVENPLINLIADDYELQALIDAEAYDLLQPKGTLGQSAIDAALHVDNVLNNIPNE